MPSSGSGTITPIAPGVGVATGTYPLPYTLLSLGRAAKLLGIAPAHFMGATAESLSPAVFPTGSTCGDLWPQHDWQKSDQVSRESFAYAIADAEQEIARAVGYWPAPMWLADEAQMYPRDFYRESRYQVVDVRGFMKGLQAKYGKMISGGRRAVSLVGTASTVGGSLAYTDDDGDGLAETATITLATVLTDECEIKVYHTGHNGEQEWEIRPHRTKVISGGNVVITFDSWLLIDPTLYDLYPTDAGFQGIDISTAANFVTAVDVYREYNDASQASAVFHWESSVAASYSCSECLGTGCPACADTTQDGCMHIRDEMQGTVVPVPAAYSSGSWTMESFSVCRAPDRVHLWYYAGDRANLNLRGSTCEPLSDYWAWIILWLSIARLERPPCSCNRLENWFDFLRTDLIAMPAGGTSHFTTRDIEECPFGTHYGEVKAWKRIKNHIEKRARTALI